ncbi:hypothetical protein CSUNSWCD_132 [Campylobacter showae CSUNSWCD]|uniref:Uncharacterized protein n=1 Tax=Campylobacter showae CSUNSWCD TaxID=1244083 RepID=M5II14_9BACT|nr:hypothetical protein CSUNSWCD_132 [Campylobacter showae CSUNSWCD]
MSSLDLKFLHNSQNHLAILPLVFLRSNLQFVEFERKFTSFVFVKFERKFCSG